MKKYIFFLFLSGYILHLYFKFTHFPVPKWISNYFADLLCLPIVLYLAERLIQKVQQKPSFKLSIWMILAVFAYFSVAFECFLPHFSKRYTADIGDVFCYFIGAMSFYWLSELS